MKKQSRHHYYILHVSESDFVLPPVVVSVCRSLWDDARSWNFRLFSIDARTRFDSIPCRTAYMLMRNGFEVQPFYKVKDYLYRVVKLYEQHE